jgi:hypothetical protein
MKARIAGSLVGTLITLYAIYKLYDQYQRDPLNSLFDKLIRLVKRGPYRDYIHLHETSELVAGPIYVHSDPEVQFHLTIPNKFIRPGVIIRDNVDMRGVGGMVEILDQYGNYLSCDWIKLPQYEQHKLEDGRGDVLKEQVNNLLNKEKSNGFKIIAKERTKGLNQGIPDLFFIVEENPNSYENSKQSYFNKELKVNLEPSNSEIIGRVIFTHKNRHLFVISAKYPNSMLNLDLLKKELIRLGWTMDQIEQRLNFKFDTEDNNSRLFKEMFEHATSDRNEIKEMLRQELLNQYMLDFKVDSNSISEK